LSGTMGLGKSFRDDPLLPFSIRQCATVRSARFRILPNSFSFFASSQKRAPSPAGPGRDDVRVSDGFDLAG
jgi:hypothetical protein